MDFFDWLEQHLGPHGLATILCTRQNKSQAVLTETEYSDFSVTEFYFSLLYWLCYGGIRYWGSESFSLALLHPPNVAFDYEAWVIAVSMVLQ